MKKMCFGTKVIACMCGGMVVVGSLGACSNSAKPSDEPNREYLAFRDAVDAFCATIKNYDEEMNTFTYDTAASSDSFLGCLSSLKESFHGFAEMDFPTEFDYLESVADEADTYMTTACENFTDAFTNENYSSEYIQTMYDYAMENYTRGFKRVQIIVTMLNGEESNDLILTPAGEM